MRTSEIIDSRYRVDTPISLKGYRSRFLGTDLKSGHRVIIETLHDTVVKDPIALKGIRYEIELTQKLKSPYFMQITDTIKQDSRIFLIWQYIDAAPLTHNQAFKSLTQRDICRFIGLTVKGLEFAHHKGVIHGALSTDNILITSSLTPIITGFALPGQPIETDPGTHGGISSYQACAPELIEGTPIDESCDFYSVGVIALHLLKLNDEYQSSKKRHPTQANRQFYKTDEFINAERLFRGLCSKDRSVRMLCAQAISDTAFFDSMATPAHGVEVLKLSKKDIRRIRKQHKQRFEINSNIRHQTNMILKAIAMASIGLSIILFMYLIFGLN